MRRGARLPVVDRQRCTGCGRCVAACPPHVLILEVERWKKFALLQPAQACTGCGACKPACPFGAIRLRRRQIEGAPTGSGGDNAALLQLPHPAPP